MRYLVTCAACLALSVIASAARADELTWPDADARLKVALQVAREKNDRALVDRIAQTRKQVKTLLDAHNAAGAEEQVREIESATGIDPGGWAIGGLKIFHPTPEYLAHRDELAAALNAAMASGDLAKVRAAVADMRRSLGDQAGTPDLRRPGIRPAPRAVSEAEGVDLFLKALKSVDSTVREVAEGKLVGDYKMRFYAAYAQACCEIRPAVGKYQPDRQADVDRLAAGACAVLVRMQRPEGFFPMPDLRGKSIRFGEMTEKLLAAQPKAVKDGWIVVPDPAGGSQFDTGLSGDALLAAGAEFRRDEWTRAALRGADWALQQPCVMNFNYNAFSVGLLAHAYQATRDQRYLDGALQKFRIGVAPGQVESGRWIDPHNARTVYHLIILEALDDLWGALPADQAEARGEVAQCATRAAGALLDEFEAAGLTVIALRELQQYEKLVPQPDKRLREMIEMTRSAIYSECVRGKEVRMRVAPTELAAMAR